jgi:hypothetical protein
MITRNIINIRFVLLAVSLILSFTGQDLCVFAFEDVRVSTEHSGYFRCKYEAGGVLISRPSGLDEAIADIFSANNIGSARDYALWLKNNIQYKTDGNRDSWAHPLETLERKYGDCEDLAFLNAAALSQLGYRPKVLALMRLCRNHAICVFKEGRYFTVIDNVRLKKTTAASTGELMEYLCARYDCASIREVIFATKELNIVFGRPQGKKSGITTQHKPYAVCLIVQE